jgi:hypothetical protein
MKKKQVNYKNDWKSSYYLDPELRLFIAEEQKRLALPSRSKALEAILNTYRNNKQE